MLDSFKIKTDIFEGPLDLLLSLIEKRKLLINEISLSKVADDFIGYLKTHESFPIAKTAHFILVASTLLLIKSKSLLPSLELTEEESASIEDLELRLRIFRKFKELTKGLTLIFGKEVIYFKDPSRDLPVIFSPSAEISVSKILLSVRQVIESLPKKESVPKAIVSKIISLEEMIERLSSRITHNLKMSFGEFAKGQGSMSNKGSRHNAAKKDKINVIIGFLALLELFKRGIIDVTQTSMHDDINIETKSLGLPKYS